MPARTTRVLVRISAVFGVLACGGVFVAGMLAEPPRSSLQQGVDEFQQAMDDAYRALRDDQHEDAIAAATLATELRPRSADAWMRLASAVHGSGDYARALELHRRVAATPRFQRIGLYNVACAQALLGRRDEAINALHLAFQAGYFDAAHALRDSDLESLRGDVRFERIVAKMRGIEPSMLFWLGEWDVYDVQTGARAGSNRLSLRNNGLFMLEEWRDERGASGESFNYFDPKRREWKQIWADSSGVVEFIGVALEEGGVLFEGERLVPGDAAPERDRMHVRPVDNGFVRQTGSRWDAEAEAWEQRYDLIYVPSGEAYPPEAAADAPSDA